MPLQRCDVLVGEASVGRPGLRAPPPRAGGADRHELCDSTVDNAARPSIFVCYHDDQVGRRALFCPLAGVAAVGLTDGSGPLVPEP